MTQRQPQQANQKRRGGKHNSKIVAFQSLVLTTEYNLRVVCANPDDRRGRQAVGRLPYSWFSAAASSIFSSRLIIFSLAVRPAMLLNAQSPVGIYATGPPFAVRMKAFHPQSERRGAAGAVCNKQSLVSPSPGVRAVVAWLAPLSALASPGATAPWHAVIGGSGPRLCAAATKAHSGRDNGELGGWVVFHHSAPARSPSLSPVFCVDCLTLAICCRLARTRSHIAPPPLVFREALLEP